MAVNREYATNDTRLAAHDELALIPPVSGGADIHVRLTQQPLSLEAPAPALRRPRAGAGAAFPGGPRPGGRLGPAALRAMAEQRIAVILAECVERHGLSAAAAEHRVGAVPRSEASVIVAVSAAHRAQAFAGAREAIDRIKAEAPIWKREVDARGTARRVVGSPPPAGAQRS